MAWTLPTQMPRLPARRAVCGLMWVSAERRRLRKSHLRWRLIRALHCRWCDVMAILPLANFACMLAVLPTYLHV